MKKILIATNVLLLTIILFQAHNQPGNQKIIQRPPVACPPCKSYDSIEQEGVIDGSLAISMSRDYSHDKGKYYIDFGTQQTSSMDALSTSFELEKLKNIIWHIERAVCVAHCDTAQKFGIRFYYAKYPSNTGRPSGPLQLRNLSTDCANKHTLFMVPAYFSKFDKRWHDFDYNNIPTGCFSQSPFPTRPPQYIKRAFTNTGGEDGDNHGGIGPPPEPGTYGATF